MLNYHYVLFLFIFVGLNIFNEANAGLTAANGRRAVNRIITCEAKCDNAKTYQIELSLSSDSDASKL